MAVIKFNGQKSILGNSMNFLLLKLAFSYVFCFKFSENKSVGKHSYVMIWLYKRDNDCPLKSSFSESSTLYFCCYLLLIGYNKKNCDSNGSTVIG